MKGKKVDIRLGRGLANQIKINKTIPVSHKPKEERRMMFVCGDDIASLIKRFEVGHVSCPTFFIYLWHGKRLLLDTTNR